LRHQTLYGLWVSSIAILSAFMSKYGTGNGIIRTDPGGKLAQSNAFRKTMLKDFGYVVE